MTQRLRLRSYFNRLLKQYSVYGLLLIYQTFEVKKNLNDYFATLVIKLFQSSKLWKSCTHG
jgi:hypothetical protein